MAEAKQENTSAGALGVALFRGKLTHQRRFNGAKGGFMSVVAIPAPDEYSMPGAVEVWSSKPLGEPETMVSFKARLSGIPKSWQAEREDPNTGEMRKVRMHGADNTLSVVE